MRKAIGYVRVSSVGGRSGPGYHTLDIQRQSIQRTAAFHQYELVDTLTDEDQSGKTRERPQFRAGMTRVLAGEADALIVWKVSRFSRNWREAAEDVELLLQNGKDLLSEEGFDTATAGGRLLLRILFSMANWEHDVLGEHWETIKTKAVRDRGSHLGPAPLGYQQEPNSGGRLEPNTDAPLVEELFTLRAGGATWAQLADHLDRARPRPTHPRGRKDVERIITSRVYLGEVRWRDEIRSGAHPAIIPSDLWEQANRIIILEEPRRPRRSKTREFPLTGWLHCGGCAGPMSGSMDRGRGQYRPNYKCSRRTGHCPRPQSISAPIAEAWALEQAASMHGRLRARADSHDSRELADVLRDLEHIERALHDLASVDARRELGEDWMPMVRQLRAEKLEVERHAATIRRTVGLSGSEQNWDDLLREERWELLRRMAPLGAVVGFADRSRSPASRLGFILDENEPAMMSDGEQS